MTDMVGRQEFLASQIAGDLERERSWNLEKKKEEDKRILFYLLLAPVMHRGGRNRCWKKWWRRAQSMADRPTAATTAIETKP